jgi:3-hydroxy-3-methylglutaryl CoA synthase
MVAITTCTGHVPTFHVPTDRIQERWGGGAKGVASKAVGALDDDAVSIAIETAGAVSGASDVGALWFASTTHPYQHGEVGPMLVESLGARASTLTTTLSAHTRAGTVGVRSAIAHAEATDESALVVASEVPHPEPDTEREKVAGAGGAAVLVKPTTEEGLVMESTGAHSKPLLEEWQEPGGTHRAGDDRFVRDSGYVDTLSTAGSSALDAAGWAADDLDALVVSQPNPKYPGRLTRSLGVRSDVLVAPEFARNVGDLGSASPLAVLAEADVTSGNRLLLAGYGAGSAEAVAFEVATPPDLTPAETEPTTELTYLDYLEHTDNL